MPKESEEKPTSGVSCATVNLPPEIQDIFNELRRLFEQAGVVSAIVAGSAARGELSFSRGSDGLMLRSDLEFYVVCNRPSVSQRKLSRVIEQFEEKHKTRWPEFHVDLSYLTPAQLNDLPPWIRHFELKANGWVLHGEDLISQMPDVSLQNLDWCELNDIVLWRMLGLAMRLPIAWLDGKRDLTDGETQAMAKNVLDLSFWALPGIGILESTFRGRVARCTESASFARLSQSGFVDVSVLRACLKARRERKCEISEEELFGAAVDSWTIAYGVVNGKASSRHTGHGKGFSHDGILKRLRCAFRVRQLGRSAVWDTLRYGCFRIAGERVSHLLQRASELRNSCEDNENAKESTPRETSSVWGADRRSLARYVDAALKRNEFRRYLARQDE